MYEYQVKILRIVDGDTVDVDIDLGFGVWMHRERIRLWGIDTPESRTRDPVEKVFGNYAKDYVKDQMPIGSMQTMRTQKDKEGNRLVANSDSKGRFHSDWLSMMYSRLRLAKNLLADDGVIFISIDDKDAMRWGLILSQTEGIIPAIETSHAFAVLNKKKFDKNDVIVFNCSGRGDKDLETYIEYFKL